MQSSFWKCRTFQERHILHFMTTISLTERGRCLVPTKEKGQRKFVLGIYPPISQSKMFITTFIKGEALRLLRTNSSKENFQNRLEEFQKHLRERGYPRNLITLTLSEIHFENRKEALRQKPSREKTILPFVTQYQPSVPSLKNILMKHWQLIEKQPLLRQIYKEPPIISYKRQQ